MKKLVLTAGIYLAGNYKYAKGGREVAWNAMSGRKSVNIKKNGVNSPCFLI